MEPQSIEYSCCIAAIPWRTEQLAGELINAVARLETGLAFHRRQTEDELQIDTASALAMFISHISKWSTEYSSIDPRICDAHPKIRLERNRVEQAHDVCNLLDVPVITGRRT